MALRKKELPSNRTFGLSMAGVAAALAVLFVRTDRLLAATLAGLFVAVIASVALLKPNLLASLNKGWMTLGAAIGRIVSPIVLGILFFGVFTPLALMMRFLGRDELRLRRAHGAASYWRLRDPPGPDSASFRRQF